MGNIISKNINTEQIITIKSSIPLFLDNLKSICEINMGIELGAKILNGFLLKFYIDQEIFYCLICNINNSNYDIINNNIINLYYDNKKKNVIIKIEKNRSIQKSNNNIETKYRKVKSYSFFISVLLLFCLIRIIF